jgi:glucokinase
MDDKDATIVLAADIGGSRARLLLAEVGKGGAWRAVRAAERASAEYAGAEALIADFVRAGERPVAVCLALAGPVEGQRVRMTNLPWEVDGARLARQLGGVRVRLVNDFAAQAHGLALLDANELCTLAAGGAEADGLRALLGAGTGLGVAMVVGTGATERVLPSQGGHVDFAPRTARERALGEMMMNAYGRVSLEMLLSGHGIARLYCFMRGLALEAARTEDAAAISARAFAGEAAAIETLRLFARLLAAAAGNLALTMLAGGGVFLCGGIAARILPFLQAPEVVEVFRDHPSMGAVLARIPLHVVVDERLGLKGAARIAAGLAQ